MGIAVRNDRKLDNNSFYGELRLSFATIVVNEQGTLHLGMGIKKYLLNPDFNRETGDIID